MGLFSPKLSTKQMAQFSRELAVAQSGGIPILRCLELLAQSHRKSVTKHLAERLGDCIQRGATFAQAAHWERRRLPSFFVSMVDVGERSGTLHTVLRILADYYEEMLELRGALIRQISYPLAVLFGIVVGIPIVVYIISSAVFGGGDNLALGIARIVFWQLMPFAVILALLAVIGHLLPLGHVLMRVFWHLWPVSRVVHRFALAWFGWAMALLTHTAIPLHRGIPIAAQATSLAPLERDVNKAVPRLEVGMTLAEAVATSRFLSPQCKAYIEVGETSGKLEEAFRNIAKDEYNQAMHITRSAIMVVAGVLILMLGGLVALGLLGGL